MILILSHKSIDRSTEDVIDWLAYKNANFLRLNGSDLQNNLSITFPLSFFGKEMFESIRACWFRRWDSSVTFSKALENSTLPVISTLSLQNHLSEEGETIFAAFWKYIDKKNWLSHPSEVFLNKLITLDCAINLNIEIPKTIITTSKSELISFKNKNNRIISKCVGNIPQMRIEDEVLILRTEEVNYEFINQLPTTFMPSLFQEYIEKEYELRIFYLDHKLYSMAIFSQSNPNTKIDFRNIDTKNPNRTVPYKLPVEVENKLIQLMVDLNITTGSIDMIKCTDGRYFFLECNPVGQFGMTSYPCNYHLEEKIADHLIVLNGKNK